MRSRRASPATHRSDRFLVCTRRQASAGPEQLGRSKWLAEFDPSWCKPQVASAHFTPSSSGLLLDTAPVARRPPIDRTSPRLVFARLRSVHTESGCPLGSVLDGRTNCFPSVRQRAQRDSSLVSPLSGKLPAELLLFLRRSPASFRSRLYSFETFPIEVQTRRSPGRPSSSAAEAGQACSRTRRDLHGESGVRLAGGGIWLHPPLGESFLNALELRGCCSAGTLGEPRGVQLRTHLLSVTHLIQSAQSCPSRQLTPPPGART